jgi:hypothetical protein
MRSTCYCAYFGFIASFYFSFQEKVATENVVFYGFGNFLLLWYPPVPGKYAYGIYIVEQASGVWIYFLYVVFHLWL